MKIRCVDNKFLTEKESLKKGKVYEVVFTSAHCYRVVNENGESYNYGKYRFEIVEG
ncbi:MAG: hypothetical protein ACRCX2_17205 [Paraclostridium sp.]